nr:hypothetical protein [Candidatus Sigynarchaeota archaeon]
MKDSHAKHEKKKKPSSRAFGKDLGGIYKVVNFAHRYRIYQFTRFVPYSLVIGFSHFFTKAFFARSKKMNLRVQRDIKAFSGMRFSPGLLKRLADATFKNMGIILFDVMLKAPNYH